MFTRQNISTVVAEFLGTATLVLVALSWTRTAALPYFVGSSLAITITVIVLLFGTISGAHINPAVTLGLWTARLVGTVRAAAYIAAQLLGAVAAWQLYQYLVDKPLPGKVQSFSVSIWLAEVIGTFILTMAITAAISRGFDLLESAILYGAAFFAGIMIAGTASAAYLNPAIALGLHSFSSAYVLGPLVGGLLGVNLYMWLFSPVKVTTTKTKK
jgi:glycerol uptake facilitator-like aquaporin